jgi:hypothetical protein
MTHVWKVSLMDSSPSWLLQIPHIHNNYHNPSLGFTTKAKAWKGAGQEGNLEGRSHVPKNAKVCEGMNPHTPKWTLIMGVGVPNELPNLHRTIARVKIQWIEDFLISLKSFWNVNFWNGITWPIWTFESQVMAKKSVGSQIGSLIPNH